MNLNLLDEGRKKRVNNLMEFLHRDESVWDKAADRVCWFIIGASAPVFAYWIYVLLSAANNFQK